MGIEASLSVEASPADAFSVYGEVLGYPQDRVRCSTELRFSELLVHGGGCIKARKIEQKYYLVRNYGTIKKNH